MLFRDVIELIPLTYTENEIGDILETKNNRQIFANKKSIRQNEFYQAQASGLKLELMFEIRTIDYNNETKLSFDGKEYNIIRNYSKNGEITELICEGLVNS